MCKILQVRIAWAWPAMVHAGGGSLCHLHALMPALRSSMIPGSVLLSWRCSLSCFIVESHSVWDSVLGHCKMCLVSLLGCPHQGQSAVCLFSFEPSYGLLCRSQW